MAADPLTVCYPATSWYSFTYSLSWSNKCEVAEVLSDIPIIFVGILVFTVSVLFLAVKRITIPAVWLSSSALLSFIAAVLDLGKTLADGMAINTTFVVSEAVIKAREVLFALSIGFRFLFYLSCVAEPPRSDLSAVSTKTVWIIKLLALERTDELHSGCWMRWGLPGKLLSVGLLFAIMTTTVLQIVWRIVPQFHQYSIVYGTDAALELLVSFLLLLKLLSNTLALSSPSNMSVHTFRECLAPISGLLVNIAIGVGNLLCFAFTESTVGRLLQSFEVYIAAMFVAVTAFLRYRDSFLSTTSSQGEECRNVPFSLPEPPRGSTFRITPPLIETPRMSMILGTAIQNKVSSREVLRWSAHRSLNRVSSWVPYRVSRNRACYGDEEVRLWNAEKAKVDLPCTRNKDTELCRSSASSTQELAGSARPFYDASGSAKYVSNVSALDAPSALVRSMEGSIYGGQNLRPLTDVPQCTVPPEVPTTSVLVSSIPSPTSSGARHARSISTTPEAPLVYSPLGKSPTRASETRTSLDEVLRQQEQLEQSIEALKLFSARASANSLYSNPVTRPRSVELSRSPSTGQRTVSSEVSLSNFPVPPWLTAPVPSLLSSGPTSVKRIRDRRAQFATARPTPVQDICAPAAPISSVSPLRAPSPPHFNSIPHSPLGEENESLSAEAGQSSRFDSEVTQYNVTSFIGGLATPSEPGQGNQENSWLRREGEPSVVAAPASSSAKKLLLHTLPAPWRSERLPTWPAETNPSPLARSSIISRIDVSDQPPNIVQYRTKEQTSRAPSVAPSSHPAATDHVKESVATLPFGPQLVQDANPPPTVAGEGVDRTRRTFVRPRPPPLVIQSYTEQNPGMPRVQVLADD